MRPLQITIVRATDASWNEGKHPRANNGQFGAGEGKSHAEHADHHFAKRNEHAMARKETTEHGQRELATRHHNAMNLHHAAGAQHSHADMMGRLDPSAHESSRKANEASEATKPKKEPKAYGAGLDKTHAEHDEHHAAQAEAHEEQIDKQSDPAKAMAHLEAAGAHHTASHKHRIAGKHGVAHSAAAHEASKSAHEASERTKK